MASWLSNKLKTSRTKKKSASFENHLEGSSSRGKASSTHSSTGGGGEYTRRRSSEDVIGFNQIDGQYIRFETKSPTTPHPLPVPLPSPTKLSNITTTATANDNNVPLMPCSPSKNVVHHHHHANPISHGDFDFSSGSGSSSTASDEPPDMGSILHSLPHLRFLSQRVPNTRDFTQDLQQHGVRETHSGVSPRYSNFSARELQFRDHNYQVQGLATSPAGNMMDLDRNGTPGYLESPVRSPKGLRSTNNHFGTTIKDQRSPGHSPIPSPRAKSPGPSPRALSPLHPMAFGGNRKDSTLNRHDNIAHPLPLPPTKNVYMEMVPTSEHLQGGLTSNTSTPVTSSSSTILYGPEKPPISIQTGWRKGSLLGTGSFGQVYMGFNSETGQSCAIKEVVIIPDNDKSMESAKQLMQEVSLLSQIKHDNIVQYHGIEMVDDRLFIYLEYMSNGSIHNIIRQYGPLSENCIRVYTRQILLGLSYLHTKNTVHRDIKGANILVDKGGEVKLADFGMAKHMANTTFLLSFKGSPYWMAPEVIQNKNGYDFSVDIWSLGCTVLEMATGKPPWSQYEGIAAVFKIGNSKEIPAIPEFLSEDAKSFLKSCLQRDPQMRPTAAQLLEHPFVRGIQRSDSATSKEMISDVQKLSIMESPCSIPNHSGKKSTPASPISSRPNKAHNAEDHDFNSFGHPPASSFENPNLSCISPIRVSTDAFASSPTEKSFRNPKSQTKANMKLNQIKMNDSSPRYQVSMWNEVDYSYGDRMQEPHRKSSDQVLHRNTYNLSQQYSHSPRSSYFPIPLQSGR